METPIEMHNGQFIIYLVGGIFLFLCLEAIRFFLPHLIKNKKIETSISRYFPVLELLFLFSLILGIIPTLLNRNIIVGRGAIVLAFIILLLISWFALKDIVAGMIFKSGRDIRKGKHIRIAPYKGEIERLGVRNLIIRTEEDTLVYLPYAKILQREFEIHSHQKNLHKLQFTMKVQNHKSANITSQIQEYVMLMPWISSEEKPQVKILSNGAHFTEYQIGLLALNDDYFEVIEQQIREEFEAIHPSTPGF